MGISPSHAAWPQRPDTLQAPAHEHIRTLSSPLQLDRLAMFHDIVTSPAVCPSLPACHTPAYPFAQVLLMFVIGAALWLHQYAMKSQ